MFTLRFDMRAPSIGAPTTELYAAALDMCAWAEEHGCLAVVLCEHHGSEDGYLPSPLILASAIAARTCRLPLNLTVILPFYDPVRLAEEMAVLDIISKGRTSYVFGLGYRREEYAHFGLDFGARGRIADEKVGLLRELLAGEEYFREGRRIKVSPSPYTAGGPLLMWGGRSLAAARRAGKYGMGLLAQTYVPGMQETYEAACEKHGHAPGLSVIPPQNTPTVCFVADDVDHAWDELGPYLLHDARSYAAWNPSDEPLVGISHVNTVDELRDTSLSHRVLSVSAAIAHLRHGGMLNLVPLCGGLPPQLAWPYLTRAADVVAAAAPEAADIPSNGNLSGAVTDMLGSTSV